MNNAEATMQRRFEYHNGWNRLAIAFREVPGTYQPQGSGNK